MTNKKEDFSEELKAACKTAQQMFDRIMLSFNEKKLSSTEGILICCMLLEACKKQTNLDEKTFDIIFGGLLNSIRNAADKMKNK